MKTAIHEHLTNLTESFPIHLFIKSRKNVPIRSECFWKEEKSEILERMMDTFAKEENISGKTVFGIKEYLKASPKFKMDMDAGPIIYGFSPSGSAWAIGSATYFEEWETRSRLLRTAEMAGGSVKRNGKRHYRLANFALVGEAAVLGMRTNRKLYD